MKRVFTSPDSAELSLLKNMLQKAGIRCVELNEQMAQTIPSAPFQAELWVEHEADYQAALAILEEWQRPTNAAGSQSSPLPSSPVSRTRCSFPSRAGCVPIALTRTLVKRGEFPPSIQPATSSILLMLTG